MSTAPQRPPTGDAFLPPPGWPPAQPPQWPPDAPPEASPKVKAKLPYFSLSDYIIIAMMAAMGIAVKLIVVPLAQIITGPLFIPGGAVAGGFYMMFLVLGESVTRKRGTATLIALVQAVIVTVTGSIGSHGAASLLTYTIPGVAVDLLFFIIRHKGCCSLCCFLGGVVANLSGVFSVNIFIFNLSFVPMMLSLCAAALSGGLGGAVAHAVAKQLRKLKILHYQEE